MSWWYTPFVRIGLSNGGVVKLLIVLLLWSLGMIVIGMGLGRKYL
jgi:hypothetical protein